MKISSIFLIVQGIITVILFYNFVPYGGQRDTGYSELYFKDPSMIPIQAMPGQILKFAYVIENHELEDMSYECSVYTLTDGVQELFGNFVVDVQKDQSAEQQAEVTIPESAKTKLMVECGRLSLYTWVEIINP